ncbi:MAG: HAD-IB family phosphatase [Candidatus Calescibacterium sp.]
MEEGKIEAFISDIISKFCTEKKSCREIKRKEIVFIDDKEDFVFSDKLKSLIFDIFGQDFAIVDKKEFFDLIWSIKVNYKKKRKGAFTIRAHSEIHKFLFCLWIEMITGLKLYRQNWKIENLDDLAFSLGANYRFPVVSLLQISTKNMIHTLTKTIELMCEGKFFVLDSIESLAVALLLSYSSPKSKNMMIFTDKENLLPSYLKAECLKTIFERIGEHQEEKKYSSVVFFCDFDGTITKKDVSIAVLDKFTDGEWRNSLRSVVGGNIGSKDVYKLVKDKIKGNLGEMRKFAREFVEIEDGFLDFAEFLQRNSFDLQIVSDGFSFYISEILDKFNLKIKFFSSELLYDDVRKNFDFSFPNESDFCSLCATCKLKIIRRNENYFRVFIGNGISDRCAVESAEIIFAKSRLKQICFIKGLDFFKFENFHDILHIVRKNLKGFIIDFDGTIGWSYEGILDAFRYTFRKFNLEVPDGIEKLIGLPLRDCFKLTLGEDKADRAVEIFRKRYRKVFLRKTYLANGVKETLEILKKLNYKIAILSNKKGDILRQLLAHFEIDHLVDLAVGEGDVLDENSRVILKPNPRVIDFVLSKLGLSREEVFIVGDSFVDFETAKASNTDYIHLYRFDSDLDKLNSACGFISSISGLKNIGNFYHQLKQKLFFEENISKKVHT